MPRLKLSIAASPSACKAAVEPMKRSSFCLIAAALLAVASPSFAQTLGLYPIGGLFGLDATNCGRPEGAQSRDDTAYIATDLCNAVSLERRLILGERFRRRVAERFPGVVTDIAVDSSGGLAREASITQTAVVTLHLQRLDLWRISNERTLEVQAPIAMSLLVSDIATGEVLFSRSLSGRVKGVMSRGNHERQIMDQIDAQLEAAVDTIVDQASASFSPRPIETTVRRQLDDHFIVDQGRAVGLREGDLLGGDVRVIHADANYAVVNPLLGSLTIGQVLSRQVAQPTEMLARPSMMVVVAEAPERVGRRFLASMMEDALSEATSFSAAPVNPSFVQIRDQALGQSGADYRPRALPDYFLRVTALVLPAATMSSGVQNTPVQVHQARVLVELIDHSGRVLYAGQGEEIWRGSAVADLSYSVEQRDDLALTAAVKKAAQAVGSGFRPQRLRLPVVAADGGVSIDDPGGALSPGATATVLRRIGRVAGINDDVWVRVAEVLVKTANGADVFASFMDVEVPAIRRGDQIAWDAMGQASASRRWYGQCTDGLGRPRIDQRGAVSQPIFPAIAQNAFAGGFRAPVRIVGFENELRPLVAGQFADLDDVGALRSPTDVLCFEPVHQVDASSSRQRGSYLLTDYDLTIGYVIRRSQERLAGIGRQQKLSGVAVSLDADREVGERVLQQELATATSTMAAEAAASLEPPQ